MLHNLIICVEQRIVLSYFCYVYTLQLMCVYVSAADINYLKIYTGHRHPYLYVY